nr:MAG TPA: hypothetical protein [Caudoviricetes sp.]
MIEKDKLVELMQEYLFAAKELHDYTASEGINTPCGFDPSDSIHVYCTPKTYGTLTKLFDPGSSHVRSYTSSESLFEFATIGGIPIKIVWTIDKYKEVRKQRTL